MKYIAMWSGPRNISTAMMRSWENRDDTKVIDEPLYAYYLKTTGIIHPGNDEVLASQPNDWQTVAQHLTEPFSDCDIYYQKHMAHHLRREVELDWLDTLTNCFLIRNPEQVVSSYSKSREQVTAYDLGYEQQDRLFEYIKQSTGKIPLVIDTKTFLQNPEQQLIKICQELEVPFSTKMLDWPAGKRESDGVWAPYWYANVEKSTGFQPYQEKTLQLTKEQQAIAKECMPYYEKLYQYRLL